MTRAVRRQRARVSAEVATGRTIGAKRAQDRPAPRRRAGGAKGGGPMSWVGLAAYSFTCWMFGIVALRVAYRLGSLAEFTLAMISIGVGGLAFPLFALPTVMPLADSARALAIGTAVVGLAVSSMSLYFSTWRMFRPGSVLAALLCTAASFAIAWSFLAIVFTQGYAWPRDPHWIALQGGALWIPYPWTAV